MRVLLADPPAYTPPYDHALAASLARAGADVRLLTSRFRFGDVPTPAGYALDERLYPLSARMGSTRARLAVKALEHPVALARLAAAGTDVLHLQWLAAPGRQLASAQPQPARVHGARPPAAPHRRPHAHMEAPVRPLRADRRPQRERPAAARVVRGRRDQAPRHPPTLSSVAVPSAATTAPPCSRSV